MYSTGRSLAEQIGPSLRHYACGPTSDMTLWRINTMTGGGYRSVTDSASDHLRVKQGRDQLQLCDIKNLCTVEFESVLHAYFISMSPTAVPPTTNMEGVQIRWITQPQRFVDAKEPKTKLAIFGCEPVRPHDRA